MAHILAGIAGLEPANAGVKVLCLTDLAKGQYIGAHVNSISDKVNLVILRFSRCGLGKTNINI